MKSIVDALATLVRKAPWLVIGVTIAISVVLGSLGGNFQPEEDSNASFAPDAPELSADSEITALFGAESSTSVMQVVISSEDGEVFTLDGWNAASAIEQVVRTGALKDLIVESEGQPGVVTWLAPAQRSVAFGAPAPTSDAELQELYLQALADTPEEEAGFVRQLVPVRADTAAPSADRGLVVIITEAPTSTAEENDYPETAAAAAAEIRAIQLPGGLVAEPFSFDLLFADDDEFQQEIGRLFGTAALIIVLVLAMVFMIVPQRRGRRSFMIGSLAAVATGIVLVVLPTLATILDSVFPDAPKSWNSNVLFLAVSLLLVLMLLSWSFVSVALRRTAADTVVTVVAIMLAISWMNGIGYLLYTDANPMASILPILLIGLGVDYAIHLTSRYRQEMANGEEVDTAISRAIKTVGVALVLATATTAVGFLTNVVNEIPALREFGVLAAVGILVSFLLMLTFVPAVRELLDRRGVVKGTVERDRLRGGDAKALGRVIGKTSFLARKMAAITVVASLVLGVFGFIGFTNLSPKFSFLDFIPTTSPLRGTFETLLEDFGGGLGESTKILVKGDVAAAESWNAMVASNQAMVDTPSVVTFGGNPAGSSPISAILQMTRPDLPAFAPTVEAALQTAGLDSATFTVGSGADVGAIYDAAYAANPDVIAGVLHRDDSGTYDAALFDITTQGGESGTSELRVDITGDFEAVGAAGLEAVATSDQIINDVVVTTLRESQTSSLWLTLVAALIILVAAFWVADRKPLLGVVTTIPVFLVVMWSFGLMVAFGIPFGPVTATISALAIGIGIPYMIHITHRYLEERDATPSIDAAIIETLQHTGGSLAGSALTTIAGFGILASSTTIPFRQFGFVTAYTILLALIAAVLVLPSMLTLWDRWQRRQA